jgi:hypothetical protein
MKKHKKGSMMSIRIQTNAPSYQTACVEEKTPSERSLSQALARINFSDEGQWQQDLLRIEGATKKTHLYSQELLEKIAQWNK